MWTDDNRREGDCTRRDLFHQASTGLYGAALAYLLGSDTPLGAAEPIADLKPRAQHFNAKAKSVIHLFMNGGPSQMDLFDPKPMLEKQHGKPYFDKIAGEVEFIKDAGAIMRSPFKFAHMEGGAWVSSDAASGWSRRDLFIRSVYLQSHTNRHLCTIGQRWA